MSKKRVGAWTGVLVVLALNIAVWGYVAASSTGQSHDPSTAALPMPRKVTNELGSPIAQIDAAQWRAACVQAGLPELPDPNGLEYEPIRRLVEASQRWGQERDGDALGRMGQIALALELYEPAMDLFAAARRLGTQSETWNYFLGVSCQQVGHSQAALEALQAARAANPDYGTTSLRIGALYFDLAEFDLAEESYVLATQSPPAPAAGWVGRGRVAVARRQFEAALNHLGEALRATPGDFLAHRLRSQALAGLDRFEEAAEAAKTSNRLPPYRGWLTFDPRLGEAHQIANTQRYLETSLSVAMSKGDMQAAAQAGERLLERLPNSVQVLSVVARVLANSGKLPRALELAQKAAQLDPKNLQALGSLADIAISLKRWPIAEAAANDMIELAPNHGRARQILGRLLFQQGQVEDSLVELRRAIAVEPQEARPRLLLVDVLVRSERWQEAQFELEELLARDPSNAQARQTLQALRARQR